MPELITDILHRLGQTALLDSIQRRLNNRQQRLMETRWKPWTYHTIEQVPKNMPIWAVRGVSVEQWNSNSIDQDSNKCSDIWKISRLSDGRHEHLNQRPGQNQDHRKEPRRRKQIHQKSKQQRHSSYNHKKNNQLGKWCSQELVNRTARRAQDNIKFHDPNNYYGTLQDDIDDDGEISTQTSEFKGLFDLLSEYVYII